MLVRSLTAIAVFLGVSLMPDVMPLSSTFANAPISECTVARAWVVEHLDDLPTTLEEFRQFTPTYQRAIWAALSDQRRAALWSSRLGEALDSNRAQSTEQISLLKELISDLDRILILDHDDPHVKAWESRILSAFPSDLSLFSSFESEIDDPLLANGRCDCNDGLWSCNDLTGPTTECGVADDCIESGSGCGFLWRGECIGTCAPVEQMNE